MAEMCGSMISNEGSPVKGREARRRRIEMRRFSAMAGSASASVDSRNWKEKLSESPDERSGGKRNRSVESDEPPSSPSSGLAPESSSAIAPASGVVPANEVVVVFGSISISGRSREMEDAVSVQPDFCRPAVSGRKPLHFFAVYDGHGGSHVATLCKERLHVFLEEELMKEADVDTGVTSSTEEDFEEGLREKWRGAMERSFERMDAVALRAGLTSEIEGSTAVVAVLTPDRLLVANCGDSRAVLSRGGRAIPLSSDHKPDRPDELERIEAAGGRVIFLNGARVLGILAVSRALGDKYLKPIVISQPEISFTERTPEDECLILASDGLWDVLSNDVACDVARRCLLEGGPSAAVDLNTVPSPGAPEGNVSEQVQQSRSRCSLAAALLTRLALGRKSADNISVIVIDLERT